MPKDTISRAIKKGTGELAGGNLEEVLYEGYGPAGVAVLCNILTDNRNRTAPEIRKVFEIADGNLGGTGCVAWMFERKGLILIPADQFDEESLMDIALEAGADDVAREGDSFEVTCDPAQYANVSEALSAAEVPIEHASVTNLPTNTVEITTAKDARKVLKLMDRLDDHDDVQTVSANFNIGDEIMAELDADEG